MKQFVTRHWSSLILCLVVIGFGLLVFLTNLKEPLTLERVQAGEDKWVARHVSDYRIRVKTSAGIPGGINVYEVVVRNGTVSERICIERCMFSQEGYTVPEIFLEARHVITNAHNYACDDSRLEDCLVIRYDATYGFPSRISLTPPGGFDAHFDLTVLSFEVLK